MKRMMLFIAYVTVLASCDNTDGTSPDGAPSQGDTSPNDSAIEGDTNIGMFAIDVSLASDINPEAPGTVGIVTWSIQGETPESAEIHFGLDTSYGTVAPVDLNEPDFRTLLLGMKPDRTYHFQVVATQGGQQYQSADQTLETGPVTNLVTVTSTILDPSSHAPGYIVSTYVMALSPTRPISESMSTGSMVFILDRDGEVVWWYQSKVGLTPRARMSYDGKSMWLIPERQDTYGAEIELVSRDTLDSTIYVVGASHDGTVVDGSVLAYIDYSEDDCDSVFELAKDGTAIEIFESTDYLPGLVTPQCHLNAVRYNEAERLYSVSDRENDIFVINRQGEVQWRLTDILTNTTYGAQQHGHQLLTGSILLFANVGGAGGSAALEYSLTDGAEVFRYAPGIFSVWYGDVQRLPGGNTLVTFSIAGVIHEVAPDGTLLMEVTGDVFGYAEWRGSLYGPPADIRL
jgi:hypothetical protein